MNKIKPISIFLQACFLISFVLYPLVEIWFWFFNTNFVDGFSVSMLHTENYARLANHFNDLPLATRIIGFIVNMSYGTLSMALMAIGFVLFGLYAKGEIFSPRPIKCLKIACYLLFLKFILKPFVSCFQMYWLTHDMLKPVRAITIDLRDFKAIILALMCLGFAIVLQEGLKLRHEQELTI